MIQINFENNSIIDVKKTSKSGGSEMKRIVSAICICILLLGTVSLSGCKKIDEVGELDSSSSSSESSSGDSSSEEQEPEVEKYYNPLTGKEMKSDTILNNRPLAIMVNNIKISLPQKGISEADVIYELPVEGGITRMMCLFSDYKKLPTTGTIRSSRHDYLELMLPLDALYVHFGGSKYAYNFIDKYNLETIDGMKTSGYAFEQDQSRAWKGREHTWFTSYDLIKNAIDKNNVRTKQNEDQKQQPFFKFATEEKPAKMGDKIATNVSAPFSQGVVATFDYDSKTKMYEKGQYAQPHIDETTGKPVTVKNVFLLFPKVEVISKSGHRDIDLSGGAGYYISNGKYKEITWSKKDVKSPMVYKDSDGKALVVNKGKSYICMIPKENKESVKLVK